MLKQETIDIVKSTVPVLQQHGETITKHFYKRLFDHHPELLNIFNQTNQKKGRQQTALSNTVLAAAMYIDQLEDILPVVKQIAHKHRSLGVKPEHYPIVGENLLAAMKEVLGEAATDEILDAWEEAYGVIADTFIAVENEMYQEASEQAGGWEGFKPFVIVQKVKESDVITSFYLKPLDGEVLPSFEPGQYISLKLDIEGEQYTHIRQYSLSDAPGQDYYRISVKREDGVAAAPDGIISNYLHLFKGEGDVIPVSAPAGDFVLDMSTNKRLVLMSGGVGLTPLISMLNTVIKRQPGRDVTFIHAARNGHVHAMKDHVRELTANNDSVKSFVCYDSPTEQDRNSSLFNREGHIDLEWLKSILPDNEAEFYFTGPIPFMRAIYKALKDWGVGEERIHFEFFGPAAELTDEKQESLI